MHPADPRVSLLQDRLVGAVLQGTDGIRFHVRELIGGGGQGWIYRAHYDEPEGILVVVKVLRPDEMTPETLRRFQREATVLKRLGAQGNPNPNLVRFYDHGIVRLTPDSAVPNDHVELPFTVLEYVHGKTLFDIIQAQNGRGLPAERTRRLLRQVVWALTSVHAHGVIHRDLKPSNILITEEHGSEIAKVTDFGLAKVTDVSVQSTMMLAGATLGYAPPEQYEKGNARVSARTDVFSLAAILFECLTGTPAFGFEKDENPLAVVGRMMTGPRPSLTARSGSLPPELRDRPALVAELDRHVARALDFDPVGRQESVREFWDGAEPALRAAAESSPAGVSLNPPRASSGEGRSLSSFPSDSGRLKYHFRALGSVPSGGIVRAAAFSPHGQECTVLTSSGLFRWNGAAFTPHPIPGWLDLQRIQGIIILPDASLLLYGERAVVVALTSLGEGHPWRLPDDDLNIRGAHADRSGIVMVGERRSLPTAIVVNAELGRPPVVRTVDAATRLCAVTRLSKGALVAVGDDGALVRVDLSLPAAIPWGRSGHLSSIVARADGGAYAVGGGGHAISIGPNFQVQLEAVQTTRDLLSVTLGADGSPWASATHLRVLQRRAGTWVRVAIDLELEETTSILRVQPLIDRILVLTADGQMLEGRPVE